MIRQGDVYWIELAEPAGSEPGYRHPHVVIQNDVFNQSRINTVMVCALTSNLKRATVPGNVLLDAGEANQNHVDLPLLRQCLFSPLPRLSAFVICQARQSSQ